MIKLSQTQGERRGSHLAVSARKMIVCFSFCLCLHVLLHPHISWNVYAKESGWGHMQCVLARCIILIDQCCTEDGCFPNPAAARRLGYLELSWARLSRSWRLQMKSFHPASCQSQHITPALILPYLKHQTLAAYEQRGLTKALSVCHEPASKLWHAPWVLKLPLIVIHGKSELWPHSNKYSREIKTHRKIEPHSLFENGRKNDTRSQQFRHLSARPFWFVFVLFVTACVASSTRILKWTY